MNQSTSSGCTRDSSDCTPSAALGEISVMKKRKTNAHQQSHELFPAHPVPFQYQLRTALRACSTASSSYKTASQRYDSHGFFPSANLNDLEMGGDMGFSREGEGMVNWVDVKNKLLFNFEH